MPIRVYKLAKELGVTSKDIMAEALNHGIEVQNHMGSLTEAQANVVRAFLYKAPTAEEKAAAEAAEAAKKKKADDEARAKAMAEAAAKAAAEAEEQSTAEAAPARTLAPVVPPRAPADAFDDEPAAAEEAPPAEAQPAAQEMAPVRPVSPAAQAPAAPATPAAPEVSVSVGDIAAKTVNRGEEETGDQTDETETTKPAAPAREVTVISPGQTNVVTTKSVSPMADKKPTRELPQRRQAQILGHKELPKEQPRPVSPGPGEGMTLTESSGSKRTFVRSPQRGGPQRGGYRGGPGGGPGGFGGRRGPNRGGFQRPQKKQRAPVERPTSCEIQLPITVKDLSAAMGLKSNFIIEKLIANHGMFPSINTTLDRDTVELIGLEFDCEITVTEAVSREKEFVQSEVETWEGDDADLKPRAPIVTFLGHVDHGKTSLLDHIRKTRVADREAGGITQHIGAYRVNTPTGDVVFLDTPGHQAFTEMRARGANVTDLVVLVVAADDGVMPQTEEAINHAKAAETPIIVAINKVDKPEANVQQVKQQLSGLGLQPEDWGGDTVTVEVSALTGQGIDELLEYLGLVSEMQDLKADPERPAVGTVIEALQRKGEGNVARVVITDGTLKRGDAFLVGHVFGKVKAIRLPEGKVVKEAGPAWPVEVPGLSELPSAGDKLYVVQDAAKARQLAEERQERMRDERLSAKQNNSLENLLKQKDTGTLNLIVKADTSGSLEVLKKEILALKHDEIEPKIIHAAVGGVTETDVTLADASRGYILGFHVTDSAKARKLAEEKGIEIRHYSVIYQLLEELTKALEGQLAPELKEEIIGHVEVKKTFKISKVGTIAGCTVLDGLITNTSIIRVTRDGIVIHEGKIASLRHIKDDVKEMKEGGECGIRLEGYDDVKPGDIFEPYEIKKLKRTLLD